MPSSLCSTQNPALRLPYTPNDAAFLDPGWPHLLIVVSRRASTLANVRRTPNIENCGVSLLFDMCAPWSQFRSSAVRQPVRSMAMEPSVTVVEGSGDDDEEWGEEDEVVVWSKGVNDEGATNGVGSGPFHHGSSSSVENLASRREHGAHPRGLLIASLANLAISYNVVS